MTGLQALLAFAETVRHGSFAQAARELGLSPSAVAKSVGRLEDDLGLRLVHRTTRRVAPTSDGRALYDRCRRIAAEVEALREDASGTRAEPSGTLRLNTPLVLGRRVVVPALAALVQRHPRLALELGFSDRYVDLVGEGLDAVVRIGALRDSSLVARRIGTQRLVVAGAPAYLASRGVPHRPAALAEHTCMAFRNPSTGRPRAWVLRDGRRSIESTPGSAVTMDDGEALVAAAVAGMGLVQVPDYMLADELRDARLVEVLARHRAPAQPISLVYPSARRITPRLRVLIEALAQAFATTR